MSIFRRARTAAGAANMQLPPPPDYNGMPVAYGDSVAGIAAQQKRMHGYVHCEGLARFATAFVADAASRVDLTAERYIPGMGWVQDFDQPAAADYAEQAKWVNMVVDRFRGKWTQQNQTLWNIVWHKRSAGEVFVTIEMDPDLGVVYTPYGFMSVSRMKDPLGRPGYTVMDKPGAKMGDGLRWLSEQEVIRFWTPHPDYPLMPYSALWAGLPDLDRHALLNKVMDRGMNSQLLARGMVWMPGEAMDETVTVGDKQIPRLQRDFYASAQQTMEAAEGSVASVAPFLVYWDSDLLPPQRIDFKLPFDDQWGNLRNIAIEDFARSTDLPSVMVINGGAGGSGDGSSSNHWSDLLVDRRTFDMTIGRDLDSVCHEDLTRYFLLPQLRNLGGRPNFPPMGEAGMWRVGYDPTRLIVNQDRSLHALDSMRLGLISFKAAAKRLGFRLDEMATPEDWAKLQQIVTKSADALDVTRIRRRQTSTNQNGQGTETNLPITATAQTAEEALRMFAADADLELVWVDG